MRFRPNTLQKRGERADTHHHAVLIGIFDCLGSICHCSDVGFHYKCAYAGKHRPHQHRKHHARACRCFRFLGFTACVKPCHVRVDANARTYRKCRYNELKRIYDGKSSQTVARILPDKKAVNDVVQRQHQLRQHDRRGYFQQNFPDAFRSEEFRFVLDFCSFVRHKNLSDLPFHIGAYGL